MTTFNILNSLGDIHTTVVGTLEDAQDKVYDLKDYHGAYSTWEIEEAK